MPKTIIKRLQLTPMQNAFLNSKAIYRGYVGGRGTGKALALNTPIPTVSGWTTMGEIRPGDQIFDEKGNVCKVVRVGEVQLNRPCFEVHFDNYDRIVADRCHEWLVEFPGKAPSIRETHEIEGASIRSLTILNKVTSVTPIESVPVRCIEVDSPSHLFLAGESMIATHNSYIGAYDIIEQTLKGPYGMTSMVVAPTYGVLHDASFKTFCEHIYNFGIDCHINNQQFVARFDKGKSILFRSAERPGRLRGKNLSSIWMDEAGEIDKEVFDIVIACLREGGRQGRISATFTPKGRQHWTYETFGQCKVCQNDIVHCTCAEKPTDVALFRSRTRDNVFLHEGFEDTIRRQYTSKFAQQELEGDFIDMNAGVFERKWFEIVEAAPVVAKRVRSWDKAGTEDGGCYTVGVLMSVTKSGLYHVEHVIREQLSAMGRNNLIKQTTEADSARFPTDYEVVIEQEPGSGGKESAEYTIKQLAGHKVFADRPSGDKVERAQPMAVQAEAGNVKLVKAAWNSLYLDELVSFPEGKFADQVDASSAAFNRLALNSKRKFFML